jgi:hypothetical protein
MRPEPRSRWCSATKGAQEVLEGTFHEAGHGIEWVENQLGTEQLGEPVEQGAAAERSGCGLLERDETGRIHGDIPNSYPNPQWSPPVFLPAQVE